jgi:4-amino-4-deoxy-L-arabinose transferase-like glycosyltransferase
MEEIGGVIKESVPEKKVEERKDKVKKYILNWLKDPYNKAFLGIFILALVVRLYFLITTINQTVWWDAADYLTEAKILAGTFNIPYYFTPRRTFLLPLIWAGLLRMGFGEISFRVLEFFFSLSIIPAIYMIGKKMFDKKIALIASFLSAVFWMYLFYSNRLMTEIPSLALLLFSVYFFWEAYANKKEKMYIWFGIFLGLAFLIRAGTLVMFAVFPIFLIITQKFKFLKNKYLWLGVLSTSVLMASFFIFTSLKQHLNSLVYFLALTPGTVVGEPNTTRLSNIMGLPGISQYADLMTHYFAGWLLLALFLFGILIFIFNTFIGFDMMVKRKTVSYDKYLLILLLALVPFIFQSILYDHSEDRYLMNAFPSFFLALSLGLTKIEQFFRKYNKYLGAFIVVLLLAIGGYQQLAYGNVIISDKATSYQQVEQGALWIKANSNPSAVIISRSVPQTTYYAEREVLNIPDNQTDFEKLIQDSHPTFLELSVFEPHPDWIYSYPQNHTNLLIPVQGYQLQGQTALVIYKFNNTKI